MERIRVPQAYAVPKCQPPQFVDDDGPAGIGAEVVQELAAGQIKRGDRAVGEVPDEQSAGERRFPSEILPIRCGSVSNTGRTGIKTVSGAPPRASV